MGQKPEFTSFQGEGGVYKSVFINFCLGWQFFLDFKLSHFRGLWPICGIMWKESGGKGLNEWGSVGKEGGALTVV